MGRTKLIAAIDGRRSIGRCTGKLLRIQLVVALDVGAAEEYFAHALLILREEHQALPADQMSAGADFVAELRTPAVDAAGGRST